MIKIKSIVACLFVLMLTGCSSLKIDAEPVDKPRLDLQDPSPLDLNGISFKVITSDNCQTVLSSVENHLLMSLTDADYKNLILNLSEIEKYILLEKDILNRYRDYYEPKKEN